jgi:hypothetical protein
MKQRTDIHIVDTVWLPFGWDGLALGKFVFLKKKALLAHEMVHIGQQRRLGLLTYLWRYLTSRDFRISMEKEAYIVGSNMTEQEALKHIQERYW